MRARRSVPSAPGLALVLAFASPLVAQDREMERARQVYERWCAECHGYEGRGDGPAAATMIPRPRDFTRGVYQLRTTPTGELPRDEDILKVIDEGMPGTAMPGWQGTLSRADRRALVQYLKSFSAFFEQYDVPDPIRPGRAPRVTDAGLAEGRRLFEEIECWQCHGWQGRGDGPSTPTLVDDWDQPIRPQDLSKNWQFGGGGSVDDIYMRLRTGLDGTPMPSFDDLIDAGIYTEEQMWNLAQYVRSLSPERAPRVRDVIRAHLVEGELPGSVDDAAWDEAESFYIPLVAQIIVPQRWFEPTVSGVWVQALHDAEELALRLTWHDPSRSPDPEWLEWQERMLEAMEPKEGGPTEPQALPDAFAVQFPRRVPDGVERPYFLMGTGREPVYLWHWQSEPERVVEALGRGFPRIDPLPADQQALRSDSDWEDGRWRVVLRRAIATDPADGGRTDRLPFETGVAIPIAFYAWDGDNAEAETRASIGSWYYIYLDQPVPGRVYATPVAAMLLTGMLGLVVVARAQRRERLLAEQGEEARPTET